MGEALLADYGLFHLEADLRWIELTSARLDALRPSPGHRDQQSAEVRHARATF